MSGRDDIIIQGKIKPNSSEDTTDGTPFLIAMGTENFGGVTTYIRHELLVIQNTTDYTMTNTGYAGFSGNYPAITGKSTDTTYSSVKDRLHCFRLLRSGNGYNIIPYYFDPADKNNNYNRRVINSSSVNMGVFCGNYGSNIGPLRLDPTNTNNSGSNIFQFESTNGNITNHVIAGERYHLKSTYNYGTSFMTIASKKYNATLTCDSTNSANYNWTYGLPYGNTSASNATNDDISVLLYPLISYGANGKTNYYTYTGKDIISFLCPFSSTSSTEKTKGYYTSCVAGSDVIWKKIQGFTNSDEYNITNGKLFHYSSMNHVCGSPWDTPDPYSGSVGDIVPTNALGINDINVTNTFGEPTLGSICIWSQDKFVNSQCLNNCGDICTQENLDSCQSAPTICQKYCEKCDSGNSGGSTGNSGGSTSNGGTSCTCNNNILDVCSDDNKKNICKPYSTIPIWIIILIVGLIVGLILLGITAFIFFKKYSDTEDNQPEIQPNNQF
jgi:hypothetical protein